MGLFSAHTPGKMVNRIRNILRYVSARGLYIVLPRQGCLLRQLHLDFGINRNVPASKSRFLISFLLFSWFLLSNQQHRLMERMSLAFTGIVTAANVIQDERPFIG